MRPSVVSGVRASMALAALVAACSGATGTSPTPVPRGASPVSSASAATPAASLAPATPSTIAPTPTPTPELPVAPPGIRGYHALAGLGPDLAGVALHGGERTEPPRGGVPLNDLWRSDADGSWSLASEGVLVPFADAIAFDSQSGLIVVFGLVGPAWNEPRVETWAYAVGSGTWTRKTSHAPMDVHRAAYDSGSDRIVVYTGSGATWSYNVDADRWLEMHPPTVAPGRPGPNPPRTWSAMTYDVAADRVLMFGGFERPLEPDLADLWAYDLETDTWIERHPPTTPSGRHYAAMAYDTTTDRTILYGGVSAGEAPNGETWAYDYAADAWTLLADAGGPGPLGWHALAADAGDGSVVLYGGGVDRAHFTGAVWRFDPATDTWALE